MKRYRVIWFFFLVCSLVLANGGATPAAGPLSNRAGLARVSASSFRLARLSEIPRALEFKEVHLDEPQSWPRWAALYINDGSTVTQWATDQKTAEVQLDFGKAVSLSGVLIVWGEDYAAEFKVSVSSDRETWTKMAGGAGQPGAQKFSGNALAGRYLKLTCLSSGTGRGFSVKELMVFAAEGEAPGALSAVRAEASGETVRVSWDAGPKPAAFRYCVYRARDPQFTPGPENRAGCTDRLEFTEQGMAAGTYYYVVRGESFSGKLGGTSAPAPVAISGAGPESPFTYRGIVEGFYNDPWPHSQRLKILALMPAMNFNFYLYAPKNDVYHRQLWRKPYPPSELANFRELIREAKAHGVTFNYGISPGLDFRYQDPAEVRLLLVKLKVMYDLGVNSFTIGLDDIPGWKTANGQTAADHVRLLNGILTELRKLDPKSELCFVPTVYIDTYENLLKSKPNYAEYLRVLAGLDPDIQVMWTGPGKIFSETIPLAAAQSLQKVLKRKVLIWDNVPVNDCSLRWHVIMAPYSGRDPRLFEAASGIFLNPMYLPNSSLVTLYTAGQYLQDPASYRPEPAYAAALKFVDPAGIAAPLADSLKFHPLFPNLAGVDRLPLLKKMDVFWAARKSGKDLPRAEQDLADLFQSYVDLPDRLAGLDNFELGQELTEPAEKLQAYGRAGLIVLEYLKESNPEKKKKLAAEIVSCLTYARRIPWKVADNRLDGLFQPPGASAGLHLNVMESFVQSAMKMK